jgi:hypothetical protein
MPKLRSMYRELRSMYRTFRDQGLNGVIDRLNKLDIVQFELRGFLLPFRIKHVHGLRRFASSPEDVIVISVLRNGELWLKSFLSHHRELGVKRFVMLDNGSTDQTIAILSKQPDVTLLQTDAPYHAYENTMKLYLAQRFCRNRWCLCVDVDELFDFPFSSRMSFASFISYLNSKKYNAVITQMLDMFSDVPLQQIESTPTDDTKTKYQYYDISNIEATPYTLGDPHPLLKMHRGGIRKSIFDTNGGLTKVSLFLMDERIKPFVYWHHALNARIADVSCVLLHFPFVSSFYQKVVEAVESGRYGYLTSNEYASYLNGLRVSPQLQLKLSSARMLTSIEELLESGFLFASEHYTRWSERAAKAEPSADTPMMGRHEDACAATVSDDMK